MGTNSSFPIQAKIDAINLAFHTCIDNGWTPDQVFCDCSGVAQLLKHYNVSIARHITADFQNMKENLAKFPNASIGTISRDLNNFIDALANFGKSNLQFSLFFRGMDRPF